MFTISVLADKSAIGFTNNEAIPTIYVFKANSISFTRHANRYMLTINNIPKRITYFSFADKPLIGTVNTGNLLNHWSKEWFGAQPSMVVSLAGDQQTKASKTNLVLQAGNPMQIGLHSWVFPVDGLRKEELAKYKDVTIYVFPGRCKVCFGKCPNHYMPGEAICKGHLHLNNIIASQKKEGSAN